MYDLSAGLSPHLLPCWESILHNKVYKQDRSNAKSRKGKGTLDQDKIAEEEKYDGLYAVCKDLLDDA